MNKEEYLNKLISQIRYKKTHEPIREEIEAHIEDQTEAYEMDGLSYEEALEAAVAEMGDPVLVGGELDHIHRPSTPYKLLLLCSAVGFLFLLLRIFMKYYLSDLAFSAELNVRSEIIHWILGVLVMVAICRLEYSFIGKKCKHIIMTLSMMIVTCFLLGYRNMVNGIHMWFELIPGIRFSTIQCLLLYIPLYAAVLYTYRGAECKEILSRAVLWAFFPIFFTYNIPSIYEMVILAVSFMLIVTVAVCKDWYEVSKGRIIAIIWGVPVLSCSAITIFIMCFTNGYKAERLQTFLLHNAGRNNFIYETIDQVLTHAKLWGRAPESVLETLGNNLSVWNYFLLYLIAYFGIIAAILMIGILVGFIIRLGYLSITQKNQMGMLIGTGCSIVFLIQILFYVMENVGFTLFGHNYCPFLTYGGSGTTISYALCGIMLSIMRYEKVFPEKEIEKIHAKNTVIS